MKLDARRAAAFLQEPGGARVVLLHGDDEGAVRHRANTLTEAVTGRRDDPFRVAWLSREDHSRLMEEATAIAMVGGRRVIRVRDAGDSLAPMVKQVSESPGDSLIVLEAGALAGRSKLRMLVEGLENGAAIACYPEEGKALQAAIEGDLNAAGIRLDAEAMRWLLDHLGSDRGSTRGEVEKLVLYAGMEQRLDLAAVRACVGDLAAVSFDDAIYAAMLGEVDQADLAIERSLAEGMAPVSMTRGVLGHLAKMHIACGHMAAGLSIADAVRALRPPVFFKRVGPFSQALRYWGTVGLVQAMHEVRLAELACKQTGALDVLLVRRLLFGLARQGAARRARA